MGLLAGIDRCRLFACHRKKVFGLLSFTCLLFYLSMCDTNVRGCLTRMLGITYRTGAMQEQDYSVGFEPVFGCSSGDNIHSVSHTFIVLVNSASHHFAHRTEIRQTWGSQTYKSRYQFKLVFMIANNSSFGTQLDQLHAEANNYNDILMIGIPEDYHRMGDKVLKSFEWVISKCKSTFKYIIKTDDDMFIDIDRLFKQIHHATKETPDDVIMCICVKHGLALRDPDSKWYISKRDWPSRLWPTFCRGSMYVIHVKLMEEMLKEWPRVKADFNVWHEDVLITGLLPLRLKVKYISWNKFYAEMDGVDYHKHLTKDIIYAHAPNSTGRRLLLNKLYH